MASYQDSPPYHPISPQRGSGSGALTKLVALMLGIGVAVLSVVAVVLVEVADDARDDANTAAV